MVHAVDSRPTTAIQTDAFPGRIPTFAHQAAAFFVVAVVQFSNGRPAASADARIEFTTLHNRAVLAEAGSPEHRVAGKRDNISSSGQKGIDASVRLYRPVFAMSVDKQRLVVLEHLGVLMQVIVSNDIEVVVAVKTLEPAVQEELAAQQMTIAELWIEIEPVRTGRRPRNVQPKVVGRLPAVMIAVATEGRSLRVTARLARQIDVGVSTTSAVLRDVTTRCKTHLNGGFQYTFELHNTPILTNRHFPPLRIGDSQYRQCCPQHPHCPSPFSSEITLA